MTHALIRPLRWVVKHPARIAIAVLLMVLAYTCLSRCSFILGGDPTVYIVQTGILRGEYFSQNFQAITGGDVPHIRLETEGGFLAISYLASLLHETIPFLINALLIPLLLIVLLRIVILAYGPSPSRLVMALGVLLALMLTPSVGRLVACSLPFRDIAAHLFGFLGIAVIGKAVSRPEEPSPKALMLAAVCVGLAAWCRVPNILFGLPIGVLALLHPTGRSDGYVIWMQRVGWMGCGLLIGLMPLVAQNLFEGRAFYEAGQIEALVNLEASPTKVSASPKGLHPVYFRHHFPRSFTLSTYTMYSGFGCVLISLGIVLLARRSWRWAAGLLCGALIFLSFYSCYDKVVGRYLIVVLLFLLPFAGIGLGSLLAWLFRLFPRNYATGLRCFACAVLVAVGASNCMQLRGKPLVHLLHQYRDVQTMGEWARNDLGDQAVVLAIHRGLITWIKYFFRDVGTAGATWGDHRDESVLSDAVDPASPSIYLALSRLENGGEQPSWYKETLLNRFDLEACPSPSFITFPEFNLYHVRRRSTRKRDLEMHVSSQSENVLFLHARALEGFVPMQSLEITSTDWNVGVQANLQPGLNFISLPEGPRKELTLTSSRPLPSFVQASYVENRPQRIPLSEYTKIPSVQNLFEGGEVVWTGYKHWRRDWGGNPGRRHESPPFWRVTPGTQMRIPLINGKAMVRLYCSLVLFTRDWQVLEETLDQIRYGVGGDDLDYTSLELGPPYRLGNEQGVAVDVIHEFVLPGDVALSTSGSVGRVEWKDFTAPELECYLFVHRMEVGAPEHAVAQAGQGDRAKRWSDSLQLPSRPSTCMKTRTSPAWIDPTLRTLRDSVTLSFPEDEADRTRILYCVVNGHPEPAPQVVRPDGSRLFLEEAGGRSPRQTRYLSRDLLSEEEATVRVTMPGDSDRPPLLMTSGVLPVGSLHLTMDSQPINDLLLKGFWNPEQDGDRFWRWTTRKASVVVPWDQHLGRLRIRIHLKGMLDGGKKIPLTLSMNEQTLLQKDVLPGPGEMWMTVEVQAQQLRPGLNTLDLECDPWTPKRLFGLADDRELGVYVESIHVEPVAQP